MPEIQALASRLPMRWFASPAGQALLSSEWQLIAQQLRQRPGLPWLWLTPQLPPGLDTDPRGLALAWDEDGEQPRWQGVIRCGLPLPLPMESCACVVLQHVASADRNAQALLAETARVLIPGGWLLLLALNPLSPYRRHWLGSGLHAVEPLLWRLRLRDAGLAPEPVSQGLGPRWRIAADSDLQQGAGIRAAYALHAQKRHIPLTPLRQRRLLLATGKAGA